MKKVKFGFYIMLVFVFTSSCIKEEESITEIIIKKPVINAVVNFSGYAEIADGNTRVEKLLTQDEFGNYIVPIDTRIIKSGRTSTHFNIITETTRPPRSYTINGIWPITAQTGTHVFSDATTSAVSPVLYFIDTSADPFKLSNLASKVNLGWTSTRFFDCGSGNTGISSYGIKGCAPEDKLSTKTVIGPIFLSMVTDNLVFYLFTKVTYDEPNRDFEIKDPKILVTKFKFVKLYQ